MRERQFYLIVGAPESGKTHLLMNLANAYADQGQGKIIVYDMRGNSAYADWTEISFEQINATKLLDSGKYKICIPQKSRVQEVLSKLNEGNINGLLILDDTHMIEASKSMSKNLLDLCSTYRHHGADMYLVYHCVNSVPPDAYRLAKGMYLFGTNQTPDKSLKKLPNAEKILSTWYNIKLPQKKWINYIMRLYHTDRPNFLLYVDRLFQENKNAKPKEFLTALIQAADRSPEGLEPDKAFDFAPISVRYAYGFVKFAH